MNTSDDMNDFFMSDPIKIESPKYGVLELSELVLKDFSWFDKKQTQELPAREFVVQLLHSHILTPKFDTQEIRDCMDEELRTVAIQWVRHQEEESTIENSASFEEIKKVIYSYQDSLTSETRKQIEVLFESQRRFISSLGNSFQIVSPAMQLSSSITNLSTTISQMANNSLLPQASLLQSTLANVPNLTEVGKLAAELGSVLQQVSSSTQLISSIFNNVAASLPKLEISASTLDTAKFFAGLPDLSELEKVLEEAKEGDEAFNKAGFSFITSDYVSFSTARRYASISPRVRSAVITNQLAATTRSKEFEQKLEKIFLQSSVLRRRWRIVSQTIQAHRRHEYNISIPALLAQVEGIVGDILILKGLIASQGHKLYMKEPNGKLKLNNKNKPIEAPGLDKLIERSSWQKHPALQEVADLITTQLAGERNHILHGRKTNYGEAKLSVQCLLLLLVLSAEIVVFETGQIL